ncbi:TPA: hypothetical protein ACH3X1_014100 [Trebouxia sp. C0004]
MACHAVQHAPLTTAHSGLDSSFKCRTSWKTYFKWQLCRCGQQLKRDAPAPCCFMLDCRHHTRLTRCKQDTDHKQRVILCRAGDKESQSQQQDPDQLSEDPKQQVVPPVATYYLKIDPTQPNKPFH